MTAEGHPRRHAPAALRNRGPILDVLRRVLPPAGTVLEIGSGSGEHITFFAAELPGLVWQPSDLDPANLASIAAWIVRFAAVDLGLIDRASKKLRRFASPRPCRGKAKPEQTRKTVNHVTGP